MNSGLSSRARLATTPLWSHQHLASLMLNFIPTSSSFLLLSDALSRSDSSHNVIPVRRVHGESYTHPTPARGDPQQYTLLSRWNLYTAYSIIQLLFQASCHGFLSFSLSLALFGREECNRGFLRVAYPRRFPSPPALASTATETLKIHLLSLSYSSRFHCKGDMNLERLEVFSVNAKSRKTVTPLTKYVRFRMLYRTRKHHTGIV